MNINQPPVTSMEKPKIEPINPTINKNISSPPPELNKGSSFELFYLKYKSKLPYLLVGISLIIIIGLLIYYFTSDTSKDEAEDGEEGGTEDEAEDGTTEGGGTTGGTRRRQGTSANYPGNRGLDRIYDDAGGNEVLSNAQLTSRINLSTDQYSCSYNVIYTGNNERRVECTSGCDDNDDNSTFCEKYRYNDVVDGNPITGSLGDTLLDQIYIGRRRAGTP